MNPITISTLSTHIATLIENDERLRDIWVIGEVSNWKRAASGHAYFSLKDSGATISAVIWRNSANAHTWLPKSGDQIIAHGYVGLYPNRGAYQLYVNRIQPAGRGRLYEQFEALKAKLQAEGLFDDARKQPIPTPLSVLLSGPEARVAPYRVGIVTSANAAALRDILRVFQLRWPLIEVVLFPTLVQGHEAPAQIANAIVAANQYSAGQYSSNVASNPTIFEQILSDQYSDQYTDTHQPLDTLILTRGGGSIEDLWAFNDEQVAYAIAQSTLPIVTGIGHETDFTIADFVADLRMPTPSAAAAAVTPDQAEVRTHLGAVATYLQQNAQDRLDKTRQQITYAQQHLRRHHPRRQLDTYRQQLDERTHRLHHVMQTQLTQHRQAQMAASNRLEALSPRQVLQRGYSIVQRQNDQVVRSPNDVQEGEALQVQTAGGAFDVQVVKS